MNDPLWVPDNPSATNLGRFFDRHGIGGYESGHEWSVRQPDAFWAALWDEVGLPALSGPATEGTGMLGTRFFPGVALNVAEIILEGNGSADHAAMLVSADERNRRRSFDRAQVRAQVQQVSGWLRSSSAIP